MGLNSAVYRWLYTFCLGGYCAALHILPGRILRRLTYPTREDAVPPYIFSLGGSCAALHILPIVLYLSLIRPFDMVLKDTVPPYIFCLGVSYTALNILPGSMLCRLTYSAWEYPVPP